MQRQLQLDLARHADALHESMVILICAHDEKYADLPERVHRLESAVFACSRVDSISYRWRAILSL
jgi:hypothetical protein